MLDKDTAATATATAKSLQSCPTLCDPLDGSPQAPLSLGFSGKNPGVGCHFLLQCMRVKSESEVAQSCPTLSDPMVCSPPGSSVQGFSRQEYWSGVPLPSPRKQAQRSQHAQVHTGESKGNSWDSDPGVSDFKVHRLSTVIRC